MSIRRVTSVASDIDAIIHQRRATYLEVGFCDVRALDIVDADYRVWVGPKLDSGEYLGWFALAPDCSIAAGLGLWLIDNPPSLFVPGRRRGNIVNVYTEPPDRRQGLARALIRTAIAWCAAHDVSTIVLHSTPDGRALYESLGFTPTTEMRLATP